MLSPPSKNKLSYKKAIKYCQKLEGPCQHSLKGACDERTYARWRVPTFDEISAFNIKEKKKKFYWTSITMTATGAVAPAVYAFYDNGLYRPSHKQDHQVRCVRTG